MKLIAENIFLKNFLFHLLGPRKQETILNEQFSFGRKIATAGSNSSCCVMLTVCSSFEAMTQLTIRNVLIFFSLKRINSRSQKGYFIDVDSDCETLISAFNITVQMKSNCCVSQFRNKKLLVLQCKYRLLVLIINTHQQLWKQKDIR